MSKPQKSLQGRRNLFVDNSTGRIKLAKHEDGKHDPPVKEFELKVEDNGGKYRLYMERIKVFEIPTHSTKDRLRGYDFDWTFDEMGKSDWGAHAEACWPSDHLELPIRIEKDDQMVKILHNLIEKYGGSDLNGVLFPIEEAYSKYFDDSVFKALHKQFPDLDEQAKKAENQIEIFQNHQKYEETRSALSIDSLDRQGRSLVYLTEEFEVTDVDNEMKRAILVKHQMALSSRVVRMEDTLMMCFEDDELAADKILFTLKLVYVRMAKRMEFNVPRLLSVDLTPSSVAPRSGKEFIDLIKQYCCSLTDTGHPRAEILVDVFTKAEETARSKEDRKKYAELQRVAIMSHGLFGAYFFLEVMELWEFILIPEGHQLYTFHKDFLHNYLCEKEISPADGVPRISKTEFKQILDSLENGHEPRAQALSTMKIVDGAKDNCELPSQVSAKKKSGNKKKKKKNLASEGAISNDQANTWKVTEPAQDNTLAFLKSLTEIANNEAAPTAPVQEPKVLSEESRQAIINELLAMESATAEKPHVPSKKKKKTNRLVKKGGKPKNPASSVVDDSDAHETEETLKDEKPLNPQAEETTSAMESEGWNVVKLPKRAVKEIKPFRKQRYGDGKKDIAGPKAVTGKPTSIEGLPKFEPKPEDPARKTYEQTEYRQALLKPVITKEPRERDTVTTWPTVADGKRPAKAKPQSKLETSKPKPDVLSPKDIEDLSEFPVLTVAKDMPSGKPAATLRIATTSAVSNSGPTTIKTAEPTTQMLPSTVEKPKTQESIVDTQKAKSHGARIDSEVAKSSITSKFNSASKPANGNSNAQVEVNTESTPMPKSTAPANSASKTKTIFQLKQQTSLTTGENKKKMAPSQKLQDKDGQEIKSASEASRITQSELLNSKAPIKTSGTSKNEQSNVIHSTSEQSVATPLEEGAKCSQDRTATESEFVKIFEPVLSVSPPIQQKQSKTQPDQEKLKTLVEDDCKHSHTNGGSFNALPIKENPAKLPSAIAKTTENVATASAIDASVDALGGKPAKESKAEMKQADVIVLNDVLPNLEVTAVAPKSTPTGDYFLGPNQIRFGSLIVEQATPSGVGSPLAVLWGDSEIDSEDEFTRLDDEPHNQPSKLSQETTLNYPTNPDCLLSEPGRVFLKDNYVPKTGISLSDSPIIPKPGPIIPLRSAFKKRSRKEDSVDQVSTSWPFSVDAVPYTEHQIAVTSHPVGIRITVSGPPSPDLGSFEPVQTLDSSNEETNLHTMDGTFDGVKFLNVINGGNQRQDISQKNNLVAPRANNTLKVPELVSVPIHVNGHGLQGTYPSVTVNWPPMQEYLSDRERRIDIQDNEGLQVSLRNHIFTCPNCKKSLRHRCSIVCPGCGPEALVRFCSRDCFFDQHEHWKDCGKMSYNRPMLEGVSRNNELMVVSKTQWNSSELWRQAIHLWEDETVDYFIFSTETSALLGSVVIGHKRSRFQSLRDNCMEYQDPDLVSLLYRALWHQCQSQGIKVSKIELRHLFALEYGQDIPSFYIPPISDYEWACAEHALNRYGAHDLGYSGNYYHGSGPAPQFH